MKYVVYFVPHEGIHPIAPLDLYKLLWPIMHKSVNDLGYELVHLTDSSTKSWGDETFRVDVSPETTVYSRDLAWLNYLQALPDGEQACMIEPDTIMVEDIPPIRSGFDMVLLRRPISRMCGWFKLATNRAVPFYKAVVANYPAEPERKVFHGDIDALHQTVGLRSDAKAIDIPRLAHGVNIEIRDWTRYGFRKGRDPYLLQFKGTSKQEMLNHATTE